MTPPFTALLENSEGIIALEFPISGTLEKPVLDFSEVVNRAISGQMAGFSTKGEKTLFEPVFFQPGAAEIVEKER